MPKHRSLSVVAIALAMATLLASASALAAPAGTAFTYQGKLDRGGSPASGSFDLEFKLWDAASGGSQVGSTQTVNALPITNGLFTVTLDFGGGAFDGNARWLEIAVQGPGDGGFTLLAPRQSMTVAPYAIRALTGGGGFALPFAGSWSGGGNAFDVANPNGSGVGVFGNGGFVGIEGTGGYAGVYGHSTTQYGVAGETTAGASGGVRGRNYGAGPGVEGIGSGGPGASGTSGNGHGVTGTTFSASMAGVYGTNSNGGGGNGVHGVSAAGFGVYGTVTGGSGGAGVFGQTAINGTSGVLGRNESAGPDAQAVYGYASGGAIGVLGVSEGNDGIVGRSNAPGKSGLWAYSTQVDGVGGSFHNFAGGVALSVTGLAQVQTLQIMGGADLAERFAAREAAEPGTVMAIDPDSPGRMRVADQAYCRRVAGVVSGANDLEAGVVLSEDGAAEGTLPIALTGRVWVKCDASLAPIRPGDLLTTADRAGHAMAAVDPVRASGAILGKAMTSLERGTGMVLVLVSLQ